MALKIVFALVVILGTAAIFYVSWFWRALIAPMVLLLVFDLISSLFKKVKK